MCVGWGLALTTTSTKRNDELFCPAPMAGRGDKGKLGGGDRKAGGGKGVGGRLVVRPVRCSRDPGLCLHVSRITVSP